MHSRQRARQRQLAAIAVAALLLGALSSQALSQSASPSSASPSSQSAGHNAEVARQTALAIAGAASMTGPPPNAAQGPGQTSARQMTADQRREFMMLLILHETSRSPIGALR
jgi:hypothetical protein